jgi:hypothetical protein
MPDPDRPDEAPAPAPPGVRGEPPPPGEVVPPRGGTGAVRPGAPPPPGDFPPMPPAPPPDRAERQRCLSAVGEVLFGQPGPASLHDAFERIRALIEGDGGRAK